MNNTFQAPSDVDKVQWKFDKIFLILDDIDSLSDAIRPSNEAGYKAFYHAAMNLAGKRHSFVEVCK